METFLFEYGWVLGFVIVGAVLLHALVLLVGSLQRIAHQKGQFERERELLEHRIAAARTVRREHEQALLAWTGYRKFEVHRKVDEGGGICSFYLRPHDRKALPGFHPGQYLTFRLDLPGQDKPVIRCYSLSDAPGQEHYRVSIKRLPPPRDKPEAPPGIASNFFHREINENDILDVKAPSGHFVLDMARDAPIVLVGGGVGITPVLSMLNAITASGSSRETWFFYGVRHSGEHIMAEHLRRIEAEHDNVHLHVCYSHKGPGDRKGRDYHHSGWVSVDLFRKLLPSNNYDFYICGPPPMMQAITGGLEEWGVPKSRIHFEAFGPATVKKTAPKPSVAADAPAAAVTFSRSGRTESWNPKCDSLLDFAEEHGIVIDSGCRAGNCGTCLTAIKSGEVEYTTEPGAETEDGSCLTCVCVPKGALVLDA